MRNQALRAVMIIHCVIAALSVVAIVAIILFGMAIPANAALNAKTALVDAPKVDLVVVFEGDAYVVDTGMTMADCKRAMSTVKTFTLYPGISALMSDTTARACVAK